MDAIHPFCKWFTLKSLKPTQGRCSWHDQTPHQRSTSCSMHRLFSSLACPVPPPAHLPLSPDPQPTLWGGGGGGGSLAIPPLPLGCKWISKACGWPAWCMETAQKDHVLLGAEKQKAGKGNQINFRVERLPPSWLGCRYLGTFRCRAKKGVTSPVAPLARRFFSSNSVSWSVVVVCLLLLVLIMGRGV